VPYHGVVKSSVDAKLESGYCDSGPGDSFAFEKPCERNITGSGPISCQKREIPFSSRPILLRTKEF
jgi:hypothetical protein